MQQEGFWINLGADTFEPGAGHRIILSDLEGVICNVHADAVQIVPASAAPNTATWALDVVTADDYNVAACPRA